MLTEHWFWGLATVACLLWYCLVTLYVALKGVREIRQMLARLSATGRRDG